MAITSLLGGGQSRSEFYGFLKEMIYQTQYQSDSTISTNTTATGTIFAKNLTINNSITLTVYDKLGMIVCDTLTLNGTITATGIGGAGGENAATGSSYGFGGNGGGSIIILAKTILGAGTISANGTNGTRVGNIAGYSPGTAPIPGRFKKLVGAATAPINSNSPGLGQVKIIQNDGLNGFINGSFIADLEPGDCIFSGGGTGSSGGNSSTITGDGGGGGASLFFDGGTGGDVLVSATSGGLGGGGGGGGGFIFIASMSSVPALTISANGGNGASTTLLTNNNSGGGGGGAGGVVAILAPSNSATMSATAGTGGTGNFGNSASYSGANGTAGLTMFKAMNLS